MTVALACSEGSKEQTMKRSLVVKTLSALAGIVIYGLIVQSIPLFRISLDGTVDQRGNQNIAILANLMLLGVIGIFAGVGTLIYYVAKKTK
jgi:hypothetical protein